MLHMNVTLKHMVMNLSLLKLFHNRAQYSLSKKDFTSISAAPKPGELKGGRLGVELWNRDS